MHVGQQASERSRAHTVTVTTGAARQIACHGAFVVVVDIDEAGVRRTAVDCPRAWPGNCGIATDPGDFEAPQKMLWKREGGSVC
jgi:hypothetical protein